MSRFHTLRSTARLGAASLLLAALAGLPGCSKADGSDAKTAAADNKAAKKDKEAAEAVPVEAVKASHRAVAASYSGTTTLEPRAESQVIAKTSGVALAVLVEEGQQVKAGQPLVRLDADRAQLTVAQSEAQMRKLESNYQRAIKLVDRQMISANDVDQLRYDLENMRAQHRLARLELSYTTVTAPIAGVVASRSIKPGNFVQINSPIIRIVDRSRLEATLNVPERELATLRAGQPVMLQADALPGKTFTGKVDRVAPVVDAGSGTFRVVCAFDGESDTQLQAGMFGRLRIEYDHRDDALVIPRTALLDDGDPAVYLVRAGKAVRTAVEPGYVDGEWVEIRKGLKAGDAVVTAGKVALRDGSTVTVIDAPPKPAGGAVAQAGGKR